MRGALITVKCDCGSLSYLAYGEARVCPDCGRRWDTTQIPSEEYWGIMRRMRNYRFQAMGVAAVMAAGFAVLAATQGQRALLFVPFVFGGWFLVYMPMLRRRMRRATRQLPTWLLRPEP